MANITVVGSGGWGTAIATLLNNKNHNVSLWSWKQEECETIRRDGENKEFLPGVKISEKINLTSDISCVADKDLIVLVSPSKVIISIICFVASNFVCHYAFRATHLSRI